MNELKPCLWCKAKPFLISSGDYEIKHKRRCPINGLHQFIYKEDFEEWNTRAGCRWVPVSERLPLTNIETIILTKRGAIKTSFVCEDGSFLHIEAAYWLDGVPALPSTKPVCKEDKCKFYDPLPDGGPCIFKKCSVWHTWKPTKENP